MRVDGTDLFVLAAGMLPIDHVLCDVLGEAVIDVPGYRNHRPELARVHARCHAAGARVVRIQ